MKTNDYKEHDGKIYCEDHFVQLIRRFKENCPICDKPTTNGKVVVDKNKAYHEECFVCSSCKQPFPDGKFCPSEGKFYCQNCFIGAQLAEVNRGGIIKVNSDEE